MREEMGDCLAVNRGRWPILGRGELDAGIEARR
jgi:hypothetical protein